ncbi:MAG: adenylate/guanylate cyclase domain-containing protein [Nitrospirae bacterium]|nr:adenylate/guanylate cyclase domain-containing protein [Nitrospirota bacterium]
MRRKRSAFTISLIVGLLVAAIVIGLRKTRMLEVPELNAYDAFLQIAHKGAASDDRVVIVEIAEGDIHKLGHWPMTDADMASLITIVFGQGPRVVGLDIYRDIPVPPGKEDLMKVFSRHNIVSVRKIGDDSHSGVAQPYAVIDQQLVGFNDVTVDPDGIIRRGLLFMQDGETVYPSFSLLLAGMYLKSQGIAAEPGKDNPDYLKLGRTTFVPLTENEGGYAGIDSRGYQYLIDYRGGVFKKYSLSETLQGHLPSGAFRDKIVLIGMTAESSKDFFFTPVSKNLAARKPLYGVELHGYMTGQLLRAALDGHATMAGISEPLKWIWILLAAMAGAFIGLYVRAVGRFSLSVAAALFVIAGLSLAAFAARFWIPMVPAALACISSASLMTAYMSYREKEERGILMQIFSKHVSSSVAETLWLQRDQFMEHGRLLSQKITATVLFTDLKGFTSISEKMEPQALMGWLNEYMEAMTGIVIARSGVVNKYIGDAVMALFGVPVARPDIDGVRQDAINAVTCALEMGKSLSDLNRRWRERGLPTVDMRVGIFTGPVVSGCVGSSERMEFTVIGDTVNVASRLESFAKDEVAYDGACRIIIGESTRALITELFVTRKIGEFALKGKEDTISIYLVQGPVEGPESRLSMTQ